MRMDKRLCDFIVRYGKDDDVHRGFYDHYDNVKKEYDSIKLGKDVQWKELVWEPLDHENYQEVLHSASVRMIELFKGRNVSLPCEVLR